MQLNFYCIFPNFFQKHVELAIELNYLLVTNTINNCIHTAVYNIQLYYPILYKHNQHHQTTPGCLKGIQSAFAPIAGAPALLLIYEELPHDLKPGVQFFTCISHHNKVKLISQNNFHQLLKNFYTRACSLLQKQYLICCKLHCLSVNAVILDPKPYIQLTLNEGRKRERESMSIL